MSAAFRVLGIDASLRSTGLAVVESKGSSLSLVATDTARISQARPRSECLGTLHQSISSLIHEASPTVAAIEACFYSKNARTAELLGEARGTAIAVCAAQRLDVYEYVPRRVKQAVVGYGTADKTQVRKMVMTLLGLVDEPQEDVGDALAIAICHIHSRSTHDALMSEPI